MTIAPPMPVPSVMHRTKRCPVPAPNRLSPSAVVLASLSTTTGIVIRLDRRARNGSSRQARCGENITVDRLASTKPAAPMPTAATS